ncbi:Decaprenyl-diphosphate synthase subunit [Echinococcus granulosus]|uniref:Decaprenyl-diphosphate synthase subunit n=1 Tax=Echinococcus granulosus TaxID=6210 RepID=W6UEG1_ECHGR|nr:Decaprenyl-diphosphate synthase subunit [Echinococcus granulosus]EUB59835.1 Decaprenyl-diphosphate synthase subunit [Echinococcus granulosus]
MPVSLLLRRSLGCICDFSNKLTSLRCTIITEQIRTKFSRASVSAAKRCSGAARDVEIIAMTDVKRIPDDIKNVLLTSSPRISVIADYAFSGKGKMLRPLLVLLMAACANGHNDYSIITSDNPTPVLMFSDRHLKNTVTDAQHAIAVIAEMIHTASLIHDDLIDKAEMRRKKLATYRKFGSKDAVLVGNVTLLKASELLAKVGDAEVVSVLSTVLDDLIRGEFMQLTSNSDENYRFHLYLEKTYKKTASLIANSCKAVTILSKVGDALAESAYAFGRHLGMAFQLLDDVLDFVGQEDKLGKPAGGSDLQLGLATGPVLFAAQQFPELERMLQTGFRTPEDQKKALEFIHESNGVGQTRMLAEFHFQEAQRQLGHFKASDARKCLLQVAATTLLRSF